MNALIETLRVLRLQGRDIGVAGYDIEISAYDSDVDRDAAMAVVKQEAHLSPPA